MKGDIVHSPTGERIELVDIGMTVLVENEVVRVWDVALEGNGQHPWHLHHNPYVVLSLRGSEGRMDWLDGSPSRFISEYRGGAVYRPTSPVHRLTNLRDHVYQNRLVELKDLGELLPEPFDIGDGARSTEGASIGPDLADGRHPVIDHPHVRVWTVDVEADGKADLELTAVPHVLALVDAPDPAHDSTGGVAYHDGGPLSLANGSAKPQTWFVLELSYRADVEATLNVSAPARWAGAAPDASRELEVSVEGADPMARFREILLQTGDLDWVDKTLAGLTHKALWRDDDTGASISLVRFEKGVGIPSRHSHASNQFMFCLSGTYTYLPTGITLTPGSFYWNPKGSMHGPTVAEEECVLLEVYDGPHYPTQPDWYSDPADAH